HSEAPGDGDNGAPHTAPLSHPHAPRCQPRAGFDNPTKALKLVLLLQAGQDLGDEQRLTAPPPRPCSRPPSAPWHWMAAIRPLSPRCRAPPRAVRWVPASPGTACAQVPCRSRVLSVSYSCHLSSTASMNASGSRSKISAFVGLSKPAFSSAFSSTLRVIGSEASLGMILSSAAL